ncbi:MAG: P-loop NTPase [Coriobacteriales bacterium]|jgi:pilus assembly protein CpaE|nr:P-loop NTPase [Coriobacteriales bacterium]
MDERAVAYSFVLPDGKGTPERRDAGELVPFFSSEQCRFALRGEPPSVSAIVCNGKGTVTAVNLAAALCADAPERDIYLMEDHPTGSLVSRARTAGIRGIINGAQADSLLAPFSCPGTSAGDRRLISALPVPHRAGVPSSPLSSLAPSLSPAIKPSVRQGRVVCFLSGRGGVGKSTVALMTALAAQRRGDRVALVDLDLQFGDMDYLAGREPAGRIERLSLAQLCGREDLPPLPDEVLALVLAPERPEQGEQLAPAVPLLLERLAAVCDLVVINTGSFWTDVHAQAVRCCDHLVFLMDQRATSIEACKQAVDLCIRLQAAQTRFHYLLNGCGRHAALTPQDVGLALGGVEVHGLADGGSLVDELLALGCPLELLGSGNAFVASIEAFLDTLMGHLTKSTATEQTGRSDRRGAKIFDLTALRGFFGEARRVAP